MESIYEVASRNQEQNIIKCKDTVRKINDRLVTLGYKTLYNKTHANILCKTSDVTAESIANMNGTNSASDEAQVYIIRKKCAMLLNGTCSSTIAGGTCLQTGCKLPNVNCPLYGGGNNNGSSGNVSNDSNSGVDDNVNYVELLEAIDKDNYLIRIRPSDIFNGIFLHVIMLHNEECNFKMTFGYDDDGISELVETVVFLTT